MKNICIFGDSIVAGHDAEKNGAWVDLLKTYLLKNPQLNSQVFNLGVSGDTSEEILIRFESEAKENSANTIILSFGLNDSMLLASTGKNQVIIEDFLSNIKKIFNLCQQNDYQLIITGLLPVDEKKTRPIPWHIDGSYINTEISRYNKILEEFCTKHKIMFINLFSSLSVDLAYLASLEDGVHPNSLGHDKIFKIIMSSIWK